MVFVIKKIDNYNGFTYIGYFLGDDYFHKYCLYQILKSFLFTRYLLIKKIMPIHDIVIQMTYKLKRLSFVYDEDVF